MLRGSPPPRFPIPFAASAGGSFIRPIPQASQIGVQAGAASLTDGFVPENFTQIAAGGVPPFGQDMNGILNQISLWCQWQEAGAPVFFDATFASGSGGYPQGACVRSSILFTARWVSLVDNNTVDPDTLGQTSWIQDPTAITTGLLVHSISASPLTAYVLANGLTIGSAASNATGQAASFTQLLYRNLWALSPSICPMFTSSGAPTTRGANPDADFAANNQLATPDMKGRSIIGVDTMGGSATTRLAGVPVTSGNTTTPGSIVGENLHALITAELAAHSHANTLTDPGHPHANHNREFLNTAAGTDAQTASNVSGSGANTFTNAFVNPNTTGITINNASSGSGSGHNTVEQSFAGNWNIKL